MVLEGRSTGLFYRWDDVHPAVAGLPQARYKGYATLRAAADAWSTGQL